MFNSKVKKLKAETRELVQNLKYSSDHIEHLKFKRKDYELVNRSRELEELINTTVLNYKLALLRLDLLFKDKDC